MTQFTQTSPPYPIVCPGDRLVFTCTVSIGNNAIRIIYWRIEKEAPAILRTKDKNDTAGIFFLNIEEIDSATVISSATNNSAPIELDGTNISCSADGANFTKITIDVAGKLPNG